MKTKFLVKLTAGLLACSMVLVCSCKPDKPDNEKPADNDPYADESVYTDLSVRSATGTHGAVTSANAYASKAGYDILRSGGNAFDAQLRLLSA